MGAKPRRPEGTVRFPSPHSTMCSAPTAEISMESNISSPFHIPETRLGDNACREKGDYKTDSFKSLLREILTSFATEGQGCSKKQPKSW